MSTDISIYWRAQVLITVLIYTKTLARTIAALIAIFVSMFGMLKMIQSVNEMKTINTHKLLRYYNYSYYMTKAVTL